jgi:hypothetical protein
MDMTGWITGQVFLQTVDEQEVQQITTFLAERSITYQLLTLSEHMVLDPTDPSSQISTDRFSICVQVGGFPQVIAPVLSDLIQRAHGGGWQTDPAQPA